MLRWARPVNRLWFIVDLRYVFNLLKPLNDLSAVAVVTGHVARMVIILWRFGKTSISQVFKASAALVGGDLALAHLHCQTSYSALISCLHFCFIKKIYAYQIFCMFFCIFGGQIHFSMDSINVAYICHPKHFSTYCYTCL